MYGEDVSANSRATLFTYISTLRRTLGDVIVRHPETKMVREMVKLVIETIKVHYSGE